MRIYRARSLEERFWEKVAKGGPDECWPWFATGHPRGYGLLRDGERKILAHRASWIIHHGEIPAGLHVLHRCDNPACVNPSHLFLGTHTDNMRDKMRKGRGNYPTGENRSNAKLTAAQAAEIRRRYAAGGVIQAALAAEYGVSRGLIANIVCGQKWVGAK